MANEFNHKKFTTVCTNRPKLTGLKINIKFLDPAHLLSPGPELESLNLSWSPHENKHWIGENARRVLSTGPGT